jgi:excisionase family DNA binding protein
VIEKLWLTKTEACERLNIGMTTLDKLIAEGLPHARLGRSVRIPSAELERWAMDRVSGSGNGALSHISERIPGSSAAGARDA